MTICLLLHFVNSENSENSDSETNNESTNNEPKIEKNINHHQIFLKIL